MKTLITMSMTLLVILGYAQQQPPVAIKANHELTPEEQFKADLVNYTLHIYTLGGLKPSNYKVDAAFEKKYNVHYHDFGCLAPGNMDYYSNYNLLVFRHITLKYGKGWEKDIKDNSMGFYEWTQVK